ncbi:MAG: FapA family protein [Lachnospiraceae bacterium]|nr:FapA family protein [Lachnospiraceae bacterium]
MGDYNAYFRVTIKSDGTYVDLIPPTGEGEALEFSEMQEYMQIHGFIIDKAAVARAIKEAEGQPCSVKIDPRVSAEIPESYRLDIAEDNMSCRVRFFAPSEKGAALQKEELIKDLKFKKVTFGIKNDVIDSFFNDRHYCTTYVIAEGKPVREGTDGRIEYNFNTNPDLKPTLKEDGTVDFFNLNLISPCKEGDVLAKLIPADKGDDGVNILGAYVSPKEVKEPKFGYGRNIKVSEDGLELISEISGNVMLVEDKVFVSNIYEVNDVDTSTGNIEYDGDVHVRGNVNAGFSLKATGNVEVRGVVEGAYVEAGGDIIIARGMNGMSKGKLVAGRNVVSKFIENSRVEAGGYIHSEAILHSDIVSKSDVVVTGKKGFITGGSIKALGNVEAKIIGSTMGVDTDIQVGADPTIKLKAASMQQEIAESNKKLNGIKPVLVTLTMRMKKGDKLTPDQLRTIKQLSEEYKNLNEQIERQMDEYDKYMDSVEVSDTESVVKVSDCAYPGTKITISEVYTQLKSPAQRARFVKDGADIRIKAL